MNDSIDMLYEALQILICKEENDDVREGLAKALELVRISRFDDSWRDEWDVLFSDEAKYLILKEYVG